MRPKNSIGNPFIELGEVDSTNNYAMRQVQAHLAVHGSTWFAKHQKTGKGQRGKTWEAAQGENITMTTLFETDMLTIEDQFLLSAGVALASRDLFQKYSISGTQIKWPNDVYWNDRKAGGILIENIIQGDRWKYAIAGTGININQTLFSKSLQNPVSLKQITGKTFNVVEMAKELSHFLNNRWNQIVSENPDSLLAEYCSNLYKLNETVIFKSGEEEFEAKITGVNRNGDLMVDAEKPTTLTHGSVKWVLAKQAI